VPAPERSYVIVSHDFARGRLPVPLKSLARVLLLYFISLPSGWRMTREQLDRSVLEGRDAVSKALRELEAAGYLRRDKTRDMSRNTWSWSYQITRDPVARPLPPSPESQSMGPTSGNAPSSQVGPSTEIPATGNQSISTEDGSKKTDKKTDLQDAPPVGAPAGARAGIRGEQLLDLDAKALTRKLVAVWSAVVTENGGTLPVLDGGGWDHDGTPLGRDQHPAGRQIKAWVDAYPHPRAEELDDALDKIRQHARQWAASSTRDASHPSAA
jgi:hypothetical protein